MNPFLQDLGKNEANFVSLSPVSFLLRAARVYPQRVAVVHGARRSTWAETLERCRRLGSALQRRGVQRNDVVAVMAPNIPAMYEAHFGVAMCGGILNTLNVRLDAKALAYMLKHAGAKVLLTDGEFADVIEAALALLEDKPLIVDLNDSLFPDGRQIGAMTYEALLETGDPAFEPTLPPDEWDAISVNYTSGTTGEPKGVVFPHRGAYLNAVSNALAWQMTGGPVYLWTLPMFHANGWCFPWTIAALAGTSICLRRVDPEAIWKAIRAENVTHMCGAPIVYSLMLNADSRPRDGERLHRVEGMVAGAPPSATLLADSQLQGIDLTHAYGLTEVLGPAAVCAPQDEWDELAPAPRAELTSRQGVTCPLQESMTVVNPETGREVAADGSEMGEIVFRGNCTMKGYLKNPEATRAAFADGWFHTGDLAVLHPDGYVKIRDRSKDIIISGGENISSIEVEEVLVRHPAVLAAAVVAAPDEKWGETPCAFVELKRDEHITEPDLIAFAKANIAGYKVPKYVVIGALPTTSTGKVQKFALRELAKRRVSG